VTVLVSGQQKAGKSTESLHRAGGAKTFFLKEVRRLAISKERKKELVGQYDELVDRSEALILTNPQGLSVAQISRLRNQIREKQGAYHVTKNTLIRLVLERRGKQIPEEWLEGPTAVSFCFDDVPAVAKAITDFANETQILGIKGALLGDNAVGSEKVTALADLPPIDVLQAQVLGALTGPMSGVIGVLNGLMSGLVGVLEARRDQMGEPEAA
jgi:large subunit ribosomal protein L10